MALPTVSAVATTGNEGDGYVDVVFHLSAAAAAPVSISYATANGSAGGEGYGNDFAFTGTRTLTFAAGETTKVVRLALLNDSVAEPNETFYLNLFSAVGAVVGTGQVGITIADGDATRGTPLLRIDDPVVDEKAGLALFTLTLDRPSTQGVTVTVGTANGSAAAGSDYAGLAGQTVSFAPGQTSRTVAVALQDDTLNEQAEQFSLLLSNAVGATLADNRGTATIGASDAPAVALPTISVSHPVVDEGQGYAEFVFRLSAPSTQAVSVSYASENGSAGGQGYGNDFGFTGTQTLTFAPGETVKTVRVAISDDSLAEGTESFYLSLASPVGGLLGSGQAVATIVDDDRPAGTPVLRITDTVVDEKSGIAFVTLSLDRPSTGIVRVNAATADGNAVAGADYRPLSPQVVSFAPGETTHTLAISLLDDTASEQAEQFDLVLSNAVGAILSDTRGTVTIGASDAPTAALPTITVSHPVVDEAQGYAEFVFRLSAPSTQAVSVAYASENGSAGGQGYGNDFGFTGTHTVTFAPGETVKTVRVAIVDDTTAEGTESLYLSLASPVGGLLGTGQAVATIVDDDHAAGTPTLSISDAVVDERAGVATFTVSLDRESRSRVAVNVETLADSASAGIDYVALPTQAIAFAPGETTKTVTVALLDDTANEQAEQFSLLLSGAVGATLADNRGTATIGASDTPTAALPTISVSHPVVDESQGYAEFVFRLSAPSTQAVSVSYASENGSAGGQGYGNDFAFTGTHTLTFAPGETVKTVRVAINDDTTAEGTESFYLSLASPAGGLLGTGQAVATIVDDDRATGTPVLRIADTVVDEKSGVAYLTLTLDHASAGIVRVSATTADGSAVAGADYRPLAPQVVSFAPGETTHTLAVALLDDGTAESAETFHLLLSGASGALLADTGATVVIGPSDAATTATPGISVGDAIVDEAQGYAEFVVSLSAPSTQAVSVNYGSSNGTAGGQGYGSDFGFTGTHTLSFAPGQTVQTVRVALYDDTSAESTENFFLDLASPVNGVIVDGRGVGVIRDDDAAPGSPVVNVGDVTVHENDGHADFVVSLDRVSAGTVTVNLALLDNSAQAGTDYAGVSLLPVTFAPGETSKTVSVGLVNDATAEGTETFGLQATLPAGSPATLGTALGIATVLDDDGPAGSTAPDWSSFADFAWLAYRHNQWEAHDDNQAAYNAVLDALSTRWTPLSTQALWGVDTYVTISQHYDKGGFTDGNAAAYVFVRGDSLVLSVRGTNDLLQDGADDLVPAGFLRHYELLKPLLDQVDAYVGNPVNGIRHVYVTGHSLGGAMTELYMADHPDGAVTYDAVTFAAPSVHQLDVAHDVDDRILHFEVSGDVVPGLLPAPHPGRTVNLDTALEYGVWVNRYHAMDLYRAEVQAIANEGVGPDLADQFFATFGSRELAVFLRTTDDGTHIAAGTGNDPLYTSYAEPGLPYIVLGGPGNDTLQGTVRSVLQGGGDDKTDLLIGGIGNDVLRGLGGNDQLEGGAGNDDLDGGAGQDRMSGGIGNDNYFVDNAGDIVTETSTLTTEIDTVLASVGWSLGDNLERLRLLGTDPIRAVGNEQNNILTGNSAANLVSGRGGNDLLIGAGGNDVLAGGAGRDVFLFNATLNAAGNVDRVTDFVAADDTLQLDDAVFAGIGAPGALAATALRIGTAAGDADDRVIYDPGTGRLLYDADGSGAGAAVLFATVSPGLALTTADFVIV